jgi:hypothetical protein
VGCRVRWLGSSHRIHRARPRPRSLEFVRHGVDRRPAYMLSGARFLRLVNARAPVFYRVRAGPAPNPTQPRTDGRAVTVPRHGCCQAVRPCRRRVTHSLFFIERKAWPLTHRRPANGRPSRACENKLTGPRRFARQLLRIPPPASDKLLAAKWTGRILHRVKPRRSHVLYACRRHSPAQHVPTAA